MKIIINSILRNRSLVDGPGIRTVLFLQGCDIHCSGCHNQESWDINNGTPRDIDELAEEIKAFTINKKITISGGEPLLQKEAVEDLINKLEGFNITLYTGHDIKDVPEGILKKIDYIKYGPFQLDKRTAVTPFMGSSNQTFMKAR